MDITLAVSERAVAQKRLAENPFDINAMCMLNRAQEQVRLGFESLHAPSISESVLYILANLILLSAASMSVVIVG